MLHLDLKPENLLWHDDARTDPILVDFGIAHLHTNHHLHPAGTAGFMAPGQRLGQVGRLGPHTHLYAVGVLGRWLLPDAPPDLCAWLRRLCAPDPIQRFPYAADALASLSAGPGSQIQGVIQPTLSSSTLVFTTHESTIAPIRPMAPSSAPALPQNRPRRAPGAAPQLHPLHAPRPGHSLAAVREPFFVGRDAQLGALWRSLTQLTRLGGFEVHGLVGDANSGTSCLLEAFCRVAGEHGAAHLWRLPSPGASCKTLLTTGLGLGGVPRSSWRIALQGVLDHDLAEQVCRVLNGEVIALEAESTFPW